MLLCHYLKILAHTISPLILRVQSSNILMENTIKFMGSSTYSVHDILKYDDQSIIYQDSR